MVDGGSWRKAVTLVDTESLKDFHVIFFFIETSVKFGWGNFLPHILCVCVYVCTHLCTFSLDGNICGAYCDKKNYESDPRSIILVNPDFVGLEHLGKNS